MRIAATFIACLLSVGLVSGCKSRMVSCKQDNKDYAGARELPPLTAPAGLDVPNTRNSLKVPPLATPERVRARDEGCLDTPPPFATPKTAPKTTPNTNDPPKPN